MTEIRPIPHNPAAEAAVLGAALLDARAFDLASEIINEGDFFSHANRLTWRAMAGVVATGGTPDTVTVFHALRAAGVSDEAGGLQRLSELAPAAPSSSGVRRYASIVADLSRRRRAIIAADKLIAATLDIGQRTDDVLAAAARELDGIVDAGLDESNDEVMRSAVHVAVQLVDERARNPEAQRGLSTGLADLDRTLGGGLEPGQVIVPAARPGVGKTALVTHFVRTTAKAGLAVLWWSGEMPRAELGLRLVSAATGIPVLRLRSGDIEDHEWAAIAEAREAAADSRVFIDDRPALTVAQLRATARRLKRKYGLAMIAVDYIGLMRATEGDNRTQQLGSISRSLKALAIELQVPVVVAAQLNRANENRTEKRPMLSDLRDSGEIEQDADVVLMIHREGKYQADSTEWKNIAEILVRKQRNGPTAEIVVGFQESCGRFVNRAGPLPGAPVAPRRARGFNDAPRRPATKPHCEVD